MCNKVNKKNFTYNKCEFSFIHKNTDVNVIKNRTSFIVYISKVINILIKTRNK